MMGRYPLRSSIFSISQIVHKAGEILEVNGNLSNIKASVVQELKKIYQYQIPIGQISTNELNEKMIQFTEILNREIAVYINRQGKVVQVSVGDTETVDLPEVKARTSVRLSGIRCIHTHPSGDTELSDPDLSSLRRLRFDVMAAIGRNSKGLSGSIAFFTGELCDDGTPVIQRFGPVAIHVLHQINLTYLVTIINKKLGRNTLSDTVDEEERALLVGLEQVGRRQLWSIDESLDELARLAETAGAVIVGRVSQRKERPDAAFFLGKGKVQEISMAIQHTDTNLVLIDDELTPSQQHNLEQFLGVKVLDRTALILDIFAQRANSREGKLQVELAQLKYNLPRIGGQGLVLSRLGGGIGTRGPGETKLEVDRRRIYTKIHEIEQQIQKVQAQRQLYRLRRKESQIPLVALVGYTNAGKSTLLNVLTGASALVEDKLFATLDPTTRRLVLPEKQEILLTDTVGFIQKLPHTLVTAFRATLEEVCEADLLLHVVDCSNENYEAQIEAVIAVLKELRAEDKPMIYVFNKADKLSGDRIREKLLRNRDGILVSAKTSEQLPELLSKIESVFQESYAELELCIPYNEGRVVTELHRIARIQSTEYDEKGTILRLKIPCSEAMHFMKYQRK